jgi:hypothetical protein
MPKKADGPAVHKDVSELAHELNARQTPIPLRPIKPPTRKSGSAGQRPAAVSGPCRALSGPPFLHVQSRHHRVRYRRISAALTFSIRYHSITVFEQAGYVGGHTNTVEIREPLPVDPRTGQGATARTVPIDTGFMVYNEVTYPLLTRLFRELQVPTQPTDMSFAVKHTPRTLSSAVRP